MAHWGVESVLCDRILRDVRISIQNSTVTPAHQTHHHIKVSQVVASVLLCVP